MEYEYEADRTKRQEFLRGRACTTDTTTKSWAALFLTAGMGLCIDRLCGFYSNVAIVAALVGGFACAVVVAPPDAVLESEGPAKDIAGACGCVGFALLMAAALDCVLVDNTLKQLQHPRSFLNFLDAHPSAMALPTKLFIAGVFFALVQLLVVMSIIYSLAAVSIAAVFATICCGGIFRRYIILVSFVDKASAAPLADSR